jgi:hypothetical protein
LDHTLERRYVGRTKRDGLENQLKGLGKGAKKARNIVGSPSDTMNRSKEAKELEGKCSKIGEKQSDFDDAGCYTASAIVL